MDFDITADKVLFLPALWISLTFHEFGHAYAAFRGGDDTASLKGRMSLNPLAHIDPIGTVIVPILQIFGGIPLIGWAKPVPVNPLRLRSRHWDLAVSLAGVCMNLALAIGVAVIYKILLLTDLLPTDPTEANSGTTASLISILLRWMILLNFVLILFNLLPIPPLDGSHVVAYFITERDTALFKLFETLERVGPFLLIVLVISGAFGIVLGPLLFLFFAGLSSVLNIPPEILLPW